jgi:hypothetical protein
MDLTDLLLLATLTVEYISAMYGWKPKNLNRVGCLKQVHMKNELAIKHFREIPSNEQRDISGGIILPFLAAVSLLGIGKIIEDWDNFKNGLMGRPEENKS